MYCSSAQVILSPMATHLLVQVCHLEEASQQDIGGGRELLVSKS